VPDDENNTSKFRFTDMASLEDSLSFDGAFPITFDLTGSDDLSVSRETPPLGVLNSNPSPSTVSSEAPTVSVSPAATSQVVFPASLSINSSGYSSSPGLGLASVPDAAPVTSSPGLGLASVPSAAPVTSELEPAATSTLAPYAPNQLIVKFKKGITTAQVAQFQSLFGAVSTQTIKLTGAEVWKLSGSLSVEKILTQYRSNPIFEYIEPDYIRTLGTISTQATFPNDPSFNQLWGLHNTGQNGGTPDADIDAPEAWDIQKGNPNLVIGVIDTGVDYNHQDLVGNIWTNPGEIANDGIDNDGNGYIDDIRGWDFAYNDNNPSDVQGHGTHVSGTIAGKGNNGVGVTGVAWNAKIMPLKFLNDQGSGSTSNAILAINYATAKGVKLTNNSWGGGGYSQALYDAINAAGQAGALFIAAAGNNSANADINPMYPAAYNLANIVSVASTTRTDDLSWFSNYGLTRVDLGAPGSDIYSTTPNNTYATYSGTSMASPHVAGAAALLWSQNPTWTAQQVKNTLMNTGDSIAALAGKTVSGKRLNVFNALATANLPSVTVSVSSTSVQEDGATNLVYTFTRTNLNLSSPLTVNFGASGIANAAPVGSDPADYSVLTGGSVTFNPTTKLGTVTFAAGATTATVEVDPIADTIAEIANETVALTVNSGTGYIGGSPGTATGTIVSEETLPIFSNPNPITIPDSGTSTPYPSTINVSGLSGNINSLKVTLTNLSHTYPDDIDVLLVGPTGAKALLMSDVGCSSGVNNVTLTFEPTATSLLPDEGLITSGSYKATDFETGDFFNAPAPGGPYGTDFSVFNGINPNGTWSLYVMDDAGADAGTIAGGWSLLIGTAGATKSISIAKTTDGNEAGSVSSVFTLTRTGNLSSALTVNYTLAGTATLGSDYNDPSLGQATFAAGADKATIMLPTKDDLFSDPSETIITTITAPIGYTISGPDTATATIIDNDLGTLTLVKTTDGNEAGSVSSVFTLTRTGDLSSALTVNYTLAGTATLGSDYNDPSLGQATFAAGADKATIMLPTTDDSVADPSETIITTITAPVGYTISGPDTATATIIDNDLGTLTLVKTTDGKEASSVSSVFTLTRTGDLSSALTVNYTLAGTATLGSDYNDPSLGQATFAAGADKATIMLPTTDDSVVDPSETIITTITAPVGYTISGPDTATATIIDNEDLGTLTLVKTTDGKEASSVSSVFTLTRTGDLSSALTVNYTLAGTATLGSDYEDPSLGQATFAAGADKATIIAPTDDDILRDPSETIITRITAPVGYTISGPNKATSTILDNDGNAGNNNLVGTSLADALAGVGGNDTLSGLGGDDILDGGANNDTYLFDTDLVLGSDLLIDASGIDTLDFAATTTKTINLNLGSTIAQTVTAGNLTLTLASATAFENVIGGSLNDNIVGNTLANSLTGGAGNDNLTGGLGKDTLTGSTGLDTLTYNSLGESLLSDFDVIQGYSGTGDSLDRINAPGSIAPINLTESKGTATSLTEAAIQLVLTNAAFAANTAAAFKVTGQSGTFIALNNGAAGFQAASDAIIQLSGYNIAVATPVVVI
jgi:subtilisin family serine protease/subtilisin-like proprotein convertase family protein